MTPPNSPMLTDYYKHLWTQYKLEYSCRVTLVLLEVIIGKLKGIQMKYQFLKMASTGLMLSVSTLSANAGLIDPSSQLLDDAGATQLENWYGQGDLDWNSIWYGSSGATAASWHAAVDGLTETFSIYNVTYNNSEYLIGGYNSGDWAGTGWQHGLNENFIFNLTSNIVHDTSNATWTGPATYSTQNGSGLFAWFGGSQDLDGGNSSILGNSNGASNTYGAYNGNYYGTKKGNIINEDTSNSASFTVNSLETFTVAGATSVPEPSTLAIFALSIMGLASRRFKKQV